LFRNQSGIIFGNTCVHTYIYCVYIAQRTFILCKQQIADVFHKRERERERERDREMLKFRNIFSNSLILNNVLSMNLNFSLFIKINYFFHELNLEINIIFNECVKFVLIIH